MFVGLLAAFKVSKSGSEAAFSVCLLHAASGGLTHCGSCLLMVGATLLWLAPAGFELLLLQEFYASGLWMCALLVAVPKTESVPVVFESSIEDEVAASMVAGSETETVHVVAESLSGGHVCAFLVAASENESVPVVLESSIRDASLAGSGTVSSSGGLCPANCSSLKKEKEKVLVDQAQFVLSPSQAAELDVDDGDFTITDCEWENRPAIVGCLFAGIGEQATGRVDVPDDGFVSAAACAAASTELEVSFLCKNFARPQHYCENGEEL